MRKVARPTTSFHNSETFQIEYPEQLPNSLDGMMHPVQRKILVRDGQKPLDEAETLVHEVLHHLLASSGHFLDSEDEERIVWYLGSTLTRHIGNNPEVWSYVSQLSREALHGTGDGRHKK